MHVIETYLDIASTVFNIRSRLHHAHRECYSSSRNKSCFPNDFSSYFRENRLDDRHGFSFLPSAAATTVTGTVNAPRFPLTSLTTRKVGTTVVGIGADQKEAIRSWAHRTWLRQLATWRGMTGEVVSAVAEAYPTPRALFNALRNTSSRSLYFYFIFRLYSLST